MTGRDQPVVLIAEDSENDITMLRRAFRQASITAPIQYVTDGEQTIAYLKGEGNLPVAMSSRYRICCCWI